MLSDLGCALLANPAARGVCRRPPLRICTGFYRPLEIYLGFQAVGPATDVWSVGCVLAELYLERRVFEIPSELPN